MQLRPYQSRIHALTIAHLADYPDSRPIVVAACGAGKSLLIAKLAEHFVSGAAGSVLILSSRKEILEQNAAKLPDHLVGVWSAGLGKKQLGRQITVASVQSLRKHVSKLPRVAAILIDECHVFGEAYAEMVNEILERSPGARVVGYTGTPYLGDMNRTHLWMVPEKKRVFTGIACEVGIGELLRDGYLCALTPYRPGAKLDTSGVKIDARTGDFQQNQLQAAVDTDDINATVTAEMISIIKAENRHHTLVFCAGVEHAEHIRNALRTQGEIAEIVTGSTAAGDRAALIERFKCGGLPWLVSVETMTTGFDAPIADSLILLRPSKSAVLYLQIMGRVMRLHETKSDALVIDFTDTTVEMGPCDEIEGQGPKQKSGQAPVKICDECFNIILAGLKICPCCGHEFIFAEHDNRQFDPTTGLLISGVIRNEDGSRTFPVSHVDYEIRNTAAGAPALVAHYMSEGRQSPVGVDWYNLWHHKPSVSQRDSTKWLRRQVNADGPIPLTAQEALARASFGALKVPRSVTVKPGSPFPIRFGM